MNTELKGNLGEIVSWTSPRHVHINDLRSAMRLAGIDEEMAKDMAPSNAFRRAIHKLEENRVIRQTLNEKDSVYFQFTSEHLSNGEFHYAKECDVRLDKTNGVVHCTNSGLEYLAQQLVNEEINTRGAADITRIIQKLFNDCGDLFPLREAGGVYFVPENYKPLCESVEVMLNTIGGGMKRWEMGDSARNNENAAVAIKEAIEGMIKEYEGYAEDLDAEDSRKMAKAVGKINTIRMKLDAYRGILDAHSHDIDSAIEKVTTDLNRIATGVSTKDVEPVEPDAKSETVEDVFSLLLG